MLFRFGNKILLIDKSGARAVHSDLENRRNGAS
jgi:hypothetical protein